MLSGNREVVLIVAGVFFFLPNLALALLMPETMVEVEAQTAGAADLEAMLRRPSHGSTPESGGSC